MKRVKDIMKKLWPQRMRSQLILGIALVHIVLMSLFVFDLVRKQREFLRGQNRDQVTLLASNLSANSGSFLLSNEYIGLEKLVDAYDTLPNLKYAMIVSNDGIVLAHSDQSKLGLRLNDSISLRLKELSGVHVLVENNSVVDIAAPIYNNFNKEILGWARIGMSQEFIRHNLISISRKGSIYIMLALIIGSILAIYIAERLTSGLYKLIAASERIKKGDRSARVGAFNIKELSELGDAFNQMVNEISAKERFMVNKNWEIRERVKELNCLYKLSELANGKYSVSEIMQACVNIIPSAYQYPEVTCVCIIFGDQVFKSAAFIDSGWIQEADIRIDGEQVGKVKVNYTKEMPEAQEGPFLSEERSLINSISEILGNAVERMLGEKEILKLNRLYQFTSSINEMMLKADSNDLIYQEAVDIAIQHGKFKMAWVGKYDDKLKTIVPFSYAGSELGYLRKVNTTLQDDKLKDGAIARALFNKTYYYCNDIAHDPHMITWREEALLRGYRSSISLPVIVNNEIVALYSLYMSETFFFNDAEIKMLRDVTDNIAFALDKIRLKELQKQAEIELIESEEKFRKLVEETLVGVFILQDEKLCYVNPCFARITGYSKEELLGDMTFDKLIHPDDLKKVWGNYHSRIAGERSSDQYLLKIINKQSQLLHIEIIVSFIQYKGSKAIIGTIIDITEQVEDEKRINKAVNDAQENERQQISMELHDNVKQIMAASLLNLDYIKMNLDDKATAVESIQNVRSYILEAINELRKISHRLAPSVDSSLDLEEKMQSLVDTMTITSDIDVSFSFEHFKKAIPNDIQLALYRILQEQLSNILKYASATVINIELKKQQKNLVMNIRDNGQGFDPLARKSGIGLENIRRRTNVLNGEMKISSSPGKGCDLLVSIPSS